MPHFAGATLVLPDRVVERGTLVVEGGRIVEIREDRSRAPAGSNGVDIDGVIVPGFVDLHVHGVEGHDVLDGPDAVRAVACRLPRYGVTAFCPTSIACDPPTLAALLRAVETANDVPAAMAARVLPAHLESNFINPEFRGAQPLECLRVPRPAVPGEDVLAFDGRAIIETIARHRPAVGIVTLAPELEGGLDLVETLVAAGHRVSIGHSGATAEQAEEAIARGVCHATHLFNRMSPLQHRAPGVVGAVLASPDVQAELICDGIHVAPTAMRVAVQAKGRGGIFAITDGTAGAGLPVGSRTRLGGRPIVVTREAAQLDDGTLAGSVLTMDGAFRTLVSRCGLSLVDAAWLCASTPAAALGLGDRGRLEVGAVADFVVLSRDLYARATYLSGERWRNTPHPSDV